MGHGTVINSFSNQAAAHGMAPSVYRTGYAVPRFGVALVSGCDLQVTHCF